MNIISVGMVTSLGLDWATSCAAARCGVSRARGLPHYRLQAGDPVDVRFVQGHEVELLTAGFERKGRLLRLLTGAFRDLRANLQTDAWNGQELPVYLALPDSRRTSTNHPIFLDQDVANEESEEDEAIEEIDVRSDLLPLSSRLGNWSGPLRLCAESRRGAAGFVELVQQCAAEFESEKLSYVLLGAVDSLLDYETLVWLQETARLKHPAVPAGLIPGEAAVLFLVSRDSIAAPLGRFGATALALEAHSLGSGGVSHGEAITKLISEIIDQADGAGNSPYWIASGHNGETYSAMEWGSAMHQLVRVRADFARSHVSFPATAFGDTGCAAPAVASASALAAWRRGYAPSRNCCVVAASDEGARGIIRVTQTTGAAH